MIASLLFYGLLLVFTFFAVAAFNWLVFPVLCTVLLWGLIVTAFKPAE